MLTIEELRFKNGRMSQAELGEKLGVDQSQISKWEANQLAMSTKSIIKVAQYFNVTTDELLGVDHNRNKEMVG